MTLTEKIETWTQALAQREAELRQFQFAEQFHVTGVRHHQQLLDHVRAQREAKQAEVTEAQTKIATFQESASEETSEAVTENGQPSDDGALVESAEPIPITR